MINNKWKTLFKNHILGRGLKYARDGKIKNLITTKDKITAMVCGTSNYFVEVNLIEGSPSSMHCTCPYASNGDRCKHMAAVLYLTDFDNMQTKNPSNRKLNKNLPPEQLLDLKIEVDKIFRKYADYSGFISYFQGIDFQIDIEYFLFDKTTTLINNGEFKDAFDLIVYVFIKLANTDIDDDGEISSITSLCYELWQQIATNCSVEERDAMKKWFLQYHQDNAIVDYMQEILSGFLEKELATDTELQEKLIKLKKMVEDAAGQTECPHANLGLDRDPAVITCINIMKRLGYSNEIIEEYRYSHRNFSVIRLQYIEEAEEAGDYEQLIALLLESKQLDKASEFKIHKYSSKLIDAYHIIGDKDKEKQERFDVFCNFSDKTIEDFYRVKAICSYEEWPKYRDGMISTIQNRDLLCSLYSSEQMLDKLYDTIINGKYDKNIMQGNGYSHSYIFDEKQLHKLQTIALLDQYGFLLESEHSAEILEIYEDWLRLIAESAKNLSRYETIVSYLRRMKYYKGGSKLVKSLAKEWIDTYPTRKVMVQKLEEFV